jgi:hypothetical protein
MKNDGALDVHAWNAQIESEYAVWEQLRHNCAFLYPTSPYDYEERVLDAWNKCTEDKDSVSEHPKYILYNGVTIQLRDKFAKPYWPPIQKPEGCSDALYEAYTLLHKNCNPWSKDNVLPNDFMAQVVRGGIETREDASVLLPLMLEQWRWLCSGSIQRGKDVPDTQLSDNILSQLCSFQVPEVGLQLLRHKAVYRLSPSVSSLHELMGSLLLRHVGVTSLPGNQQEPERPKEEPQPVIRKRMTKRQYPFRGVPRFYFYKPLPHVLYPELSPFVEFEHPLLPKDNHTKRLLPDDQRKKLHLMQKEASDKAAYVDALVKESPALESLTDMYRLFHYATSDNPRYYGNKATSLMNDLLAMAGILGGTEEGVRRSTMVLEEGSQLSVSGLTPFALTETKNDSLTDRAAKTEASDELAMGYLFPLLHVANMADENVLMSLEMLRDMLPGGVSSVASNVAEVTVLPEVQALLMNKSMEKVVKTLSAVRATGDKDWNDILERLRLHPNSGILFSHPDFQKMLNQ